MHGCQGAGALSNKTKTAQAREDKPTNSANFGFPAAQPQQPPQPSKLTAAELG
jgi:hypothetical protein